MKLCVSLDLNAPRTSFVRQLKWLAALVVNSVRAALHSRAQYKYERATHSRFPFTNDIWRVRGCLTLMPSQPANAVCWRAPARHHWFTDVIPGVPFATPRVRWTPSGVRMFFAHSNRLCWRMISGAVSGMNETRKLAPAAAGRWFASLKTTNYNKWRTVVAHPARLFGFQRFSIFPLASPSRHLRLVGDRRQRRTRSRRANCRHGFARAR